MVNPPGAAQAAQAPPPIAVPPVAKFLDLPGEPPIPWRRWILQFENFWTMANAGRPTEALYTPQQKSRYLLLMLGAEGARLTADCPAVDQIDTLNHQDFVNALRAVFEPARSPVRAIADFNRRYQRQGETLEEWMADLRALAVHCKFPDGQTDRMLAGQLATGCSSDKARERLYLLAEINLDRIREILATDEALRRELTDSSHQAVKAVNRTGTARGRQGGTRGAATQRPSAPCQGCGGTNHVRINCWAKDLTCNTCGKTGHIAKVCRAQPATARGRGGRTQGRGRGGRGTSSQPESTGAIFFPDAPQPSTVGAVHSLDATPRCWVEVDVWNGNSWKRVPMEADSGAAPSTLRQADFEKLGPAMPLGPPPQLRNFDQRPIEGLRGTLKTKVRFQGREVEAQLFIVPNHCTSVMGRNLLAPLQAVIKCGSGEVKGVQINPRDAYPKLFGATIGTFPNYLHRIKLREGATPTVAGLRGVPLARRKAVEEEIDKMTDQGIWEPVNRSEWVHGLVTVPKAEGGVRLTTDLKPLNQYVIPETYPIPAIKDVLVELHGARIFTKLDFRKGFFHVLLHPESRHLTTTVTSKGLRQYTRLPMGLKESSSVFQRLVAQTLAGVPGVVFYIDDIMVYGRTQEEHDQCLKTVLEKLQAADFRLAPDKCRFGVREVDFLGYVISAEGVKPDPRNIKALLDCTPPRNVKEVQAFLGMVNFYLDFLPDVASLAEPLRRLTRKGEAFSWGQEQETAFKTLQLALAEDLRVFLFDPTAPTTVTTDASDVGVGAVLSQMQEGREVPIAFASSTLTPTQRGYSASEREAWACVWALERWEKYLLGRHFTLRTDHSALQTLLTSRTTKRESSKFPRWLARLAAFDFTPVYYPGQENKVADALSRLVRKAKDLGVDTGALEDSMGAISWQCCTTETGKDPLLRQVMEHLQNGWPKQGKVTADLLPFYKLRNELAVDRGCLVRDDGRVVVPTALQKQALQQAHQGHPGIVRMKRLLRQGLYWPGMGQAAAHHVKNCIPCQLSDKSTPKDPCQHRSIPAPSRPGEQWGIDLLGPFANGQTLLAMVDYATNWPEVLSRDRWTAQDVVAAMARIFSRYGLPAAIVSDNGPQFTSREFKAFMEGNDIHHYKTAVYNPQENGAVERFNRVLKTGVQAFNADGKPWEKGLLDLLMSYRATPKDGGVSPAKAFLGREMRLAFMPNATVPMRQDEMAEEAAKARRGPLRVGDKVVTRLPHVGKGLPQYSEQKQVEKVLGRYTVKLSDGRKWNLRKIKKMPRVDETPAFLPPVMPTAPPPQQLRRSERTTKGVPPARYQLAPQLQGQRGRGGDVVSGMRT